MGCPISVLTTWPFWKAAIPPDATHPWKKKEISLGWNWHFVVWGTTKNYHLFFCLPKGQLSNHFLQLVWVGRSVLMDADGKLGKLSKQKMMLLSIGGHVCWLSHYANSKYRPGFKWLFFALPALREFVTWRFVDKYFFFLILMTVILFLGKIVDDR